MERFLIDETTNTLVKCSHHITPKDQIIISSRINNNGMQINHIGLHCFDGLIIPLFCKVHGIKCLEDKECANAHILNFKLPRELKIGENASQAATERD